MKGDGPRPVVAAHRPDLKDLITMFAPLSPDRRSVSSARTRRRRPALEALEGRQLMSVGPEDFGTVNTTTRNAQVGSVNATSSFGTSVVVWVDTFSDGVNGRPFDLDIRAQRYDSSGGKTGPEIVVAFTSLVERAPSVAINGSGHFVVTYTQGVAGGDSNVLAQRYDPSGNAVGGPIQVGAGTFAEDDSHVAMDQAGDFVVSYTRNTNNNNPDIFAKQYNSSGQLLKVIDVAITPVAETHSGVAMTQDGQFDVAWEQVFGPTDHDIYLKRYSASGDLLGTNTVAFSSALDESPSIAMDNAGNAVVAWEKGGDIKARRISSSGVQGPEINIFSSSLSTERNASVALKPGGGRFVVTYESFSTLPVLFPLSYSVAEVSFGDTVTTFDAGRGAGAVSIDTFGNYLLTYTASDPWADQNIHSKSGHLPLI
jgi:hypothetical protein